MVSQLIGTLQRALKEIEWAAKFEGAESHITRLQQEFAYAIAELERMKAKRHTTDGC